MSKILLLLAVVFGGIWWWRQRQGEQISKDRQASPAPTPKETEAPFQPMLHCKQCGLHFPAPEGVRGNQGVYCSKEHLLLAKEAQK